MRAQVLTLLDAGNVVTQTSIWVGGWRDDGNDATVALRPCAPGEQRAFECSAERSAPDLWNDHPA